MKPQQFSGDHHHHHDSLMNRRDSKRTVTIQEKLRLVYEKALGKMAAGQTSMGDGGRNNIIQEHERRNQRSFIEDPIRTMIFLGSWSHT